jgi:hypothetical protein
MIALAVLGIALQGPGAVARRTRLQAFGEVQRERALLLLEYEADCVSRGRAEDPAVLGRLVERLPDARLSREVGDGTVALTVVWRDPLGWTARRSLTVFAPGTR